MVNKLVFTNPFSQWVIMLCAFLVSIVGALLIAKFLNGNGVKRLMRFWGNKSINNSIWRDVVDFEQGTRILASMAGSNYGYLGFLLEIEENGLDSWLALTDWIKVELDKNDKMIASSSYTSDPEIKTSLVLRLSDVRSVTLFYDKSTKVYLGEPTSRA